MGDPEFDAALAIPDDAFAFTLADAFSVSDSSAYEDANAYATSDTTHTDAYPASNGDSVYQRIRWVGVPTLGVLVLSHSHDPHTNSNTTPNEHGWGHRWRHHEHRWRQRHRWRHWNTRHVAYSNDTTSPFADVFGVSEHWMLRRPGQFVHVHHRQPVWRLLRVKHHGRTGA